MIHRELCKRLKLDNIDKGHLQKAESTLKNETQKILLELEIQKDP